MQAAELCYHNLWLKMKALLWFLALDATAWARLCKRLRLMPKSRSTTKSNRFFPSTAILVTDRFSDRNRRNDPAADREQFAFEPRENGNP